LTDAALVSILTVMTKLLAQLQVDDQIPWKLDRDGKPQWLTVTQVLGRGGYVVRYPDGRLETLVDTE
jgi:ribosomal protein L35AE/L33A